MSRMAWFMPPTSLNGAAALVRRWLGNFGRRPTDLDPGLLTAAAAIVISLLAATSQAHAQTVRPNCNPDVGRYTARIDCLNKIVRSLSEQVESLQQDLSATSKELQHFVTSAALDARLTGYVKYDSALAINSLAEPRTNSNDGRCLEGFSDEVSVIAHRPCDYETNLQLQWRLLPVVRKEPVNP